MNTIKQILLSLILMTFTYADGVVAETNSGKTVILEWEGFGTEKTQRIYGVNLVILNENGSVLYHDTFTPFDQVKIVSNTYRKNKDGTETYVLEVKGARSTISFEYGDTIELPEYVLYNPSSNLTEVQSLVRYYRTKGRAKTKKSVLKLETPTGSYKFRDLVYSQYGDV